MGEEDRGVRQKREAETNKNMASHTTNMQTFRQNRSWEKQVESRVQHRKDNRVQQASTNARNSMLNGIDSFEDNLKRLGIDASADGSGEKDTDNAVDDTDYVDRIHQRKVEEQNARKEREKRRQKMLLD